MQNAKLELLRTQIAMRFRMRQAGTTNFSDRVKCCLLYRYRTTTGKLQTLLPSTILIFQGYSVVRFKRSDTAAMRTREPIAATDKNEPVQMRLSMIAILRKRTAAPSGVSVHQRHPVMFEFSPWRFVVLHEPAVCGRRGLDAHPCGRCGCGQDGWRPRCRGGGNGSPLSRQAARRVLL